MSNKGFTLIEMLLVLCIISVYLLIVPIAKAHTQAQLRFHLLTFKQTLLQAQALAMQQHREVQVSFNEDGYYKDDIFYAWRSQMGCEAGEIRFLPQGSVHRAQSIHCFQGDQQMKIVVQLGSGQMDVR